MTFLVTNLACFLLKIGSAPNFRPSFHLFNWQTAAVGTVVCGGTMFFVDGIYASACVGLLVTVFLLIHYTTPPKPWGDVSQGLIYHQVRKYLLRLRQEHVKFWRPQILLLVNNPRRQFKLIQFCNSLKKGGLFILGHVIVSTDFGAAVPEARRQQQSWTKYIDFSKIKAFVNIAISPAVEWGCRNLVLGAGLGGMRPNIVVMGFYNLPELRQTQPSIDIPLPQPSRPSSKAANRPTPHKAVQAAAKRNQASNMQETLPTDAMKSESAVEIRKYVTVIEDLVLRLQVNVAIGKGFQELEVPSAKPTMKNSALGIFGLADIDFGEPTKSYIDLWPIQMSTEIATGGQEPSQKNVLTTNFDTYTLILQLGCILHTVPSWKRAYKLRVCVFVEYESDVEEERGRVTTLLRNLRIKAEVIVCWLADGELSTYQVIVNGIDDGDYDQIARDIDYSLEDERWWQDIKRIRRPEDLSASQELAQTVDILEAVTSWPIASFQHGRHESRPRRFAALQKMLRRAKGKSSFSDLRYAGAITGERSQTLHDGLFANSSNDSARSVASDEGRDDNADDEAVLSESEAIVSGSNFDEYDLDASTEESDESSPNRFVSLQKDKTTHRSSFFSRNFDLRRAIWKDTLEDSQPTLDSVTPLRPHPGAVASDTAVLRIRNRKKSQSVASSSSQLSSASRARSLQQPSIDSQSLPKFTSNPTPGTTIAPEEATGPSIVFVETRKPSTAESKDPIPKSPATTASSARVPTTDSPQLSATALPASSTITASPASGFPMQQSIPLSFNDLPCRAQHLILNELIRRQSDDTAVVFTTLPSPMEGTCESEAESVKYISDLEVLCQDLPPTLLVHSNSMTVTMNL